jgi:hypothetical protein
MKLFSFPLALLALVSFSASAEDPLHRIPEEDHLKKTIIPKVDFENMTIPETLEYLRKAAKAADPKLDDLNIVFKAPARGAELPPPGLPPVSGIPGLDGPPAGKGANLAPEPPPDAVTCLTLRLNNVPLNEAFKYVANLANYGLRWDKYAIVLTDIGRNGKPIPKPEIRYEYKDAKLRKAMATKLSEIVIPKVELKKATVREAFEFLFQRVKALDPEGMGINIVLKIDPDAEPQPGPITLALNNVPLAELLCYLEEIGGLQVIVKEGVIYVLPKEQNRDPEELLSVRGRYEQEVKVATAPIKLRYSQTLELLKRSLGDKGDVAGARAVQQELDRLGNAQSHHDSADDQPRR